VLGRLNAADARLRAGIELRSLASDATGSLSVSVNEFATNAADRGWDLQAWHFAGQPINLSLRAAGNLSVVGSISDGFMKPSDTNQSMPVWALAAGASGDLRLVAGADLAAARALAVLPGQGDLRIDFAARTPKLGGVSAMKEAGTNLIVSANPNAPVTLTDAPVALVRSGTGRIDVGAGRDVTLGMAKVYVSADSDETLERPMVFDSRNTSDDSYNLTMFGATLYTAGQTVVQDALAFGAPRNALNLHYGAPAAALTAANFSSGGGAVTVAAGRDVNGPQNRSVSWTYRKADGIAAYVADPDDPTDISTPAVPGSLAVLPRVVPQLVNNWLFRQGRSSVDADGNTVFETLADGKTTLNTAWWVRPDYFGQGIATLGGGDVTVSAGRHVNNLSVSAASNAFVPQAGAALVEQGGGDLSVRAGGDIAGGVFYAQKGLAALRADGSLVNGLLAAGNAQDNGRALAPVIALGDAQASVVAGRALTLESVFNPTMTEQSVYNQSTSGADFSPLYQPNRAWDPSFELGRDYRSKYAQFSNFVSYSADSSVRLTALGGDLALTANAAGLATAGQWEIPNRLQAAAPTAGFQTLYTLLPPTLLAASLGGDIVTGNGVALSPAATGQLELIAAGSILLNNGATGSLRMLDNDPVAMSNTLAPRVLARADTAIIAGTSTALESHAKSGLHAQDAQPAVLVAIAGDVQGDASAVSSLSLPKAVTVTAGRDIVDLGLRLQHNSAADVSLLQAGRDIVDTTQAIGAAGAPSEVAHVLGGAGRLDLLAGRNVDLGNGSGVVTRGNLDNPYLAEGGAAIRVVAGVKAPDYASFVALASRYGSASDVTSAFDAAALAEYVRSQATGDVVKNWAYFRAMPAAAQARLLAKSAALAALAADPADRADIAATISVADANALAKFVSEPASDVSGLEQRLEQRLEYARGQSTGDVVKEWAYFRALKPTEQAPLLATSAALAKLAAEPADRADIAAAISAADASALAKFVAEPRKLGQSSNLLSAEQTWAFYRALPAAQQASFLAANPAVADKQGASNAALTKALAGGDTTLLDQRFFASLVETGKLGLKTIDGKVIGSSLKNFDALIASLFPDAAAAAGGDISNFGSQFKTEQGGAITLYAPAGSTYAGLTLGYSLKVPSAQGIFTVRGGAVSALVENDFLVNKGRVFTLGGGDITLVSQKADIDAGKGAKTAASAPPPLITVDPNGNVKVDVANSITGSGIATLKTRADIAPGNVYAIAPRGVFDAGDAGVRSSGSVLVVAPIVLNAGNISAGGAIVGAQVVVAAPSLGGVAAPSNTAAKTDDAAKSASSANANASTLPLTVDALGYGVDADEDDGEDSDDPKKKKKKKK